MPLAIYRTRSRKNVQAPRTVASTRIPERSMFRASFVSNSPMLPVLGKDIVPPPRPAGWTGEDEGERPGAVRNVGSLLVGIMGGGPPCVQTSKCASAGFVVRVQRSVWVP